MGKHAVDKTPIVKEKLPKYIVRFIRFATCTIGEEIEVEEDNEWYDSLRKELNKDKIKRTRSIPKEVISATCIIDSCGPWTSEGSVKEHFSLLGTNEQEHLSRYNRAMGV